MDIAGWLQGLGLGQYEQAFRDNDISVGVLPRLTAEDLTSIGVTSVGHRRMLLDAIAVLASTPRPVEAASGAMPASAPSAARPAGAERRQLTVMFCDLVGSTALASRLDLEDLREVIGAYHRCVADTVGRYDGFVAKYMGDGVLAYFGYPQAHEDDAERAVRASLELTRAIGQLTTPDGEELAVRVGIDTGLVVVGDLIGEGAAQEEAVVGQTPNRAARFQALAEPNAVLIGSNTKQLLGAAFTYTDLGACEFKGFDQPIEVWRITGVRPVESRFDARTAAGLTPLVGRDEEIALLLRSWHQAKNGDGQVALLCGEAGVGKSRVIRDLRERIAVESHVRISLQCSPFYSNSALHPIVAHLERALRFDEAVSAVDKLDRLDALLSQATSHTGTVTQLFAALLGIPTGDRYPPLGLSPQRQKERTIEALSEQVASFACKDPVLTIVEDVHWIDPTTLEFLDHLIASMASQRVLLVITFRPGFTPRWSGLAHVATYTLTRLGEGDCGALIDHVTAGKSLPREVRQRIIQRTDGVPLFVEELTKAVLESDLLEDHGDRYTLARQASLVEIPATLHDSLIARLDRLASAKEVAQVASVIGREFPYDLLAAVVGLDDRNLDEALGHLAAAELVFRLGQPPTAVYNFKHALVRDAAYGSLLRSKRQQIHTRIARVLEDRFPEGPPEVLAHHLTEGGQTEASVEWWARSGHLAVSRAANTEAASHFERAIVQLRRLPETDDRRRREAALQGALAGALLNVTGLASDALEQTYIRARDLCEQIGDARRQFGVEWGLFHVYIGRAEGVRARPLAERLIAWAEREQDTELLLQACHAEWAMLGFAGELSATRTSCERGWALYDESRHGDHAFTYGGHDPGVCSRNNGARAAWCLGYADRARACYEEGLALARRLSHPQIVLHALTGGMILFQLCRDDARLEVTAEATFELAVEQDFANYRSEALIMRSWLLSRRGEARDAAHLIRAGLAERQRLGTLFLRPYYLSMLACAEARAGDTATGLATITEALECARTSGEVWMVPDLLRVKGELLLGGPTSSRAAAERCFQDALENAGAKAGRTWELRSAVSLARLWSEQRRRAEARQLLEPVYSWFTEGFETADLRDAKALLDELCE